MRLSEVSGEGAAPQRFKLSETQRSENPEPDFWTSLKNYAAGSVEGLKQAGRDIPKDAGAFVSDLWDSLKSGSIGARVGRAGATLPDAAGGRVLGKLGDVATFATGGFAGPEAPPAGRMVPREPVARPLTAPQQSLQDFRKLGMTPNVPAITQRKPIIPVFNAMKALPFSPIERGLRQNVAQAGQAAERVAGEFNPAANAEQAGRTAQEAIRAFAEDREQTSLDYGEFYRLMHGAKPADLTNTIKTLKELYGRYPSAPRLSEIFTNPKLATMLTEVRPRVKETTSPILGPSGAPIVSRQQVGGTLTIPELRDLHTRIRYMMSEPAIGPETIPKADLSRVYRSLSQDMRKAAQQRGPEAFEAMQRADANYRQRREIIDRLDSITKADAPEKAFARLNAAAQGKSSGDIGLLQTARDVIPPEQWKDLGAAIIRRLGYPAGREATPGTLGPEFSLTTFKANWDTLTPKAKDLLFGQYRPNSPRDTLETVARMGANKALTHGGMSQFNVGATGGFLGAEMLMRLMMTGRLPMAELGTLTGIYALSKGLMSPKVAELFYRERFKRPMGGTTVPIPGGDRGLGPARMITQSVGAVGLGHRETPRQRHEREKEAYNANRRGDLVEMRDHMRKRATAGE